MDEFGVLTERYGLKPQGKSAPMAASRRTPGSNSGETRNFGSNSGMNSGSFAYSSNYAWNSNSVNGSLLNDNDIPFKSNTSQKPKNFGGFDDYDVFGDLNVSAKQSSYNGNKSSFDYDSIFSNSGNPGTKSSSKNSHMDDDIFAGMPGLKRSSSVNKDDLFGSFDFSATQNAAADDLLGDFGGFGAKLNSASLNGADLRKNASDFDDLIPGFGGSSPPSKGAHKDTTKSTFMAAEDPFVVLESTSAPAHVSSDLFTDPLEEISKLNNSRGKKPGGSSQTPPTLRPPPVPAQVLKPNKVKISGVSSIDELEDFAMGRVRNNANECTHGSQAREARDRQSVKANRYKEAEDAALKTKQNGVDDLESFFSVGSRSSSAPRSRATTSDPLFDSKIFNKGGPEVTQRTSSVASAGAKKASSQTILVDDLSSIFGGAAIFGEFQEVEGESEERRRARLGRHQRTQDRMAKAVADMNERDLQTQHEQEERHRLAENLDFQIKRWAAGKETNMRALLSSLQNVLWPECGWEPVPLTDLIASASVKKVYKKATLCVHPDKVQQKGATLEQKYTAEKVFDILKEAWNKFNTEELS